MAYIKVGKENSTDIELHYRDIGHGKPAVLIHGYPQCGEAWERQLPTLLEAGYRVITYDRRGFGESSKPNEGYEYDTFASDLAQVIRTLDLNGITLIGHSMGSGEIARYLSKFGDTRVARAVFISPLQPFVLKTEDNPDGLDQGLFDGFQAAASEDRFAFLKQFFGNFYGSGLLGHNGVSEQKIQYDMQVAGKASAKAIHDRIATWTTDFRADLPEVNVPSLIIQGTSDKVLPFPITGQRLHSLLKDSRLSAIDGAPHGLLWTHAEAVNRELRSFLSEARARSVA